VADCDAVVAGPARVVVEVEEYPPRQPSVAGALEAADPLWPALGAPTPRHSGSAPAWEVWVYAVFCLFP